MDFDALGSLAWCFENQYCLSKNCQTWMRYHVLGHRFYFSDFLPSKFFFFDPWYSAKETNIAKEITIILILSWNVQERVSLEWKPRFLLEMNWDSFFITLPNEGDRSKSPKSKSPKSKSPMPKSPKSKSPTPKSPRSKSPKSKSPKLN